MDNKIYVIQIHIQSHQPMTYINTILAASGASGASPQKYVYVYVRVMSMFVVL
jgi:hypothetical protein